MQLVIYRSLLWFSVISIGLWVGGTLFHMLVVQPLWSCNPPSSVYFFFKKTRFNTTIWNFFGPPWMAARLLPLLVCIAVAWKQMPGQRWLLLTCGICWLAITAYTLFFIYPINDVLFTQAGGNNTPDEVKALVSKWLLADRLRFIVGSAGYICLLRAFSRMG